jgi:hypothetical protein
MKCLLIAVMFLTLSLAAVSSSAQNLSREDVLKELQLKRAELQNLEKQFLAPSEEDRAAHAEFLSQPGTGLIRLLPRDVYDGEVYKKNNKTLTLRGAGAYYSFSRLTHEYGYGSDLQLESGYLSVGFAGTDYGMLVNLGDVPLEQINSEHSRVRFLGAYTPPTKEPDARAESRQSRQGFTAEEIRYQSRLPVEVKSTYILRSIGYSTSDVLVAFKVLRQDFDGSTVILWKLLKKFPTPELARTQ